jgi:hypothetical protein
VDGGNGDVYHQGMASVMGGVITITILRGKYIRYSRSHFRENYLNSRFSIPKVHLAVVLDTSN